MGRLKNSVKLQGFFCIVEKYVAEVVEYQKVTRNQSKHCRMCEKKQTVKDRHHISSTFIPGVEKQTRYNH